MPRLRTEISDRLWRHVDRAEGCWNWLGSKDTKGYGKINSGGRFGHPLFAHRVSWELVNGSIPDGLEIDHKCRNRGCVNPDHLEVVTHQENLARSVRYAPTHCPQGHKYTEENTYVYKGRRNCRECRRQGYRKRADVATDLFLTRVRVPRSKVAISDHWEK